jgi:hypothetical protein
MESHDDWARDWTARMEQRVQSVEARADLLDGRAGNDGGILGILGELKGTIDGMERRQERQAAALEAARNELRDIKQGVRTIDGNTTPPPPKTRTERLTDFAVKVVIPVMLVVIPAIGAIVVAYLQVKGQIAQLGEGR